MIISIVLTVMAKMMQEMGNSKGRAVYEAKLPDHFRRPQNDQALEQFIRSKYEHRRYIADEWVPPKAKLPVLDEPPKEAKRRPRPKVDLASAPIQKPAVKGKADIPVENNATSPAGQASVDLLGLDDSVTPNASPAQNVGSPPQTDLFDTTTSANNIQPPSIANQMKESQPASQSLADLQTLEIPQTQITSVSSEPNLLDISGGGKVNKDSIMALYGSQQQQQNQATGFVGAGGAYPGTQQQSPLVGGMVAPGYQQGYMMAHPAAAQVNVRPAQMQQAQYQQQMYYQQLQQAQQQMMNLRGVGGTTSAMPTQQAVPATGPWRSGSNEGQTLSNQLWQ